MNILVTGGAGFIGSHLCEALAKRGDRVFSIDDYSTGSRHNHFDGVCYWQGSTQEIASITRMWPDPDVIVHLGEYARVERSFDDSARVYQTNVYGTAQVLELWQLLGAKLVYAGSSTRWMTNYAPSPYAFYKARNAEEVAKIGNGTGFPWAITYFYNVYGPRERSDNTGTLIEKFRRQRLRGEPLTVVSPGTQRRNFTHVSDIVDGLLRVIDRGQGEYQIGAPESYSVLEVAEMFGSRIEMLPPREGNRTSSTIDTTAIESLGWRPRYRLADYIAAAVQETAAIHKEHA